jgi:coproporphyrinogen III oxidase-like Fe-S oxidoreductase
MNDNGGKPFDPVEALRCRDDILQAMYWMRGEGFGEDADAASLTSFLALDESLLREQLEILLEEGYLEESGDRYRLSELGSKEGGRRFADEFSGLQETAHGECGPDCPHCAGIARDTCVHCAPDEEPSPVSPQR